jgi:hypothetical protein
MPTLHVELPNRPSPADLEALQADLEPFGAVSEVPPVALGAAEIALAVSLFFEAAQGIDVLIRWLETWLDTHPKAYQATIRLPNGESFILKADNEEAFRAALRAAVRKL